MKFKFEGKHVYNKSIITVEFEADCIGDVIDQFEDFLRGCGFQEGSIKDYIPDDDIFTEDKDED